MSTVEPTLDSAWETFADADPSATIRPDPSNQEASPAVVELLSRPVGRDELAFGATIGTGGMGVVRAANQVRLGRTVAVKSLRPDVGDADATRKLLAEAWTTGSLEHPNIVPVYDIAVDAEHRPHIVMKRITGIEWESVLDDPDAISERFGTQDALAWNLGILMQVCNALHFAHSRGVVHRDVKPQNIMIGEFGEVYLVDWGIAVTLEREHGERLTHVSSGRIAGTPRYMAPEMVRGESVTPATDVYLLGGTLVRILTGRPPHRGWSIREILEGIPTFAPDLPEETPEELSGLVRDAMELDPAARVESAEAFRQLIVVFLEHRGSARIADQARTRLDALRAELDGEADRLTVYGHLAACRFGFQEALTAWPDNLVARSGLREALLAVIAYEIEQRDPRAATLLLDALDAPPAELAGQVEALSREVAREEARLRELQLDRDPRIGQRTRAFIALVMGLFWVGSPLIAVWMETRRTIIEQAQFSLWMIVAIALTVIWARQSFGATGVNRAFAGLLLAMPLAKLAVHLNFLLVGGEYRLAMSMELLVYTLLSVAATLAIDWRLWPSVLGFGLCMFLNSATEVEPLIYVAAGSFVVLVNALVVWLPGLPSEPVHRPDSRDDQVG